MGEYLKQKILESDPFQKFDTKGCGELVQIAAQRSRAINKKIELGVCGEAGGDPEAAQFFQSAKLDYVSASPFRVPVARLATAQAAIRLKQQAAFY